MVFRFQGDIYFLQMMKKRYQNVWKKIHIS